MKLRFDAILYTLTLVTQIMLRNTTNVHAGRRFPTPWSRLTSFNILLKGVMLVLTKIIYCNTTNHQYWESSRALKLLSAGPMWPAGLQLDHAAIEEWARRIELNDDEHSLFMGLRIADSSRAFCGLKWVRGLPLGNTGLLRRMLSRHPKKQHALMNHELRNIKKFASTKMYIGQHHDQP